MTLPPVLNYPADRVYALARWTRTPRTFDVRAMTHDEFKRIPSYNRFCIESFDGSHRLRGATIGFNETRETFVVFVTDRKVHPQPEAI